MSENTGTPLMDDSRLAGGLTIVAGGAQGLMVAPAVQKGKGVRPKELKGKLKGKPACARTHAAHE